MVAGLIVYLGFNQGGAFPGAAGYAALLLALIGVAWFARSRRAFEGFGRGASVAVVAMALFTLWVFASGSWSESWERAVIEGQRASLYLLALALVVSMPRGPGADRWTVGGLAIGLGAITTAGLITRTLPEVWSVEPNAYNDTRLSYPVGYWNALGIVAGAAFVLALHHSADERLPRAARAVATGLGPWLVAALVLTLSRGAIAATVVGVAAYLIVARPRGIVSSLLVLAPATAYAAHRAWDADLLVSDDPVSAAAVAQGESLATALVVTFVVACAAHLGLMALGRFVPRPQISSRARRTATALAAVAAVVIAVGASAAADAPQYVSDQYDAFIEDERPTKGGQARDRLTYAGSTGRTHMWRLALEAFEREPLHGTGAGTYRLTWERYRATHGRTGEDGHREDAHNLYTEVPSELGLVGAVLLGVVFLSILVALLRRARGPDRAVYGAGFAVALGVLVHAAVEFDWEVPVTIVPVFVVGGMALARRPAGEEPPGRRSWIEARVVAVAACVAIAAVSAAVAISEARFDAALTAYRSGDCAAAVPDARRALDVLDFRARPYGVIGWCDLLAGRPGPAERMFAEAIDRDPLNWQYYYSLAIALTGRGVPARAAFAEARERNPNSQEMRDAMRALDGKSGRARRLAALRLPLPTR